jgi:serine protease Do/serine protease DegQ
MVVPAVNKPTRRVNWLDIPATIPEFAALGNTRAQTPDPERKHQDTKNTKKRQTVGDRRVGAWHWAIHWVSAHLGVWVFSLCAVVFLPRFPGIDFQVSTSNITMMFRLSPRPRRLSRLAGILFLATFVLLLASCPGKGGRSKSPVQKRALKVEHGTTPFAEVASRAIPSVVNISIANRRSIVPGLNRNPIERFFQKQQAPPQLPESETRTLGSGLIFDNRGFILTNYHVVRDVEGISVRLADGRVFAQDRVKIVGTDAKSDIAVLKLESDERLTAATLGNSDSLKVGQWAIAIGDPFGLSGSVSVGVISAVGRSQLAYPDAPSYQDFIQTDAAINPGSSGGPLLNVNGEVIGINTAIHSTVGGNVGIGFAIPIKSALRIAEQLMRKGKVTRGYLGITIQEITPSLQEALGLTTTEGVVVGSVVSGSPADHAGLKSEDVITRVDSSPVQSVQHFRMIVADLNPGTTVTLTVLRGAEELRIKARLIALPETVKAELAKPSVSEVTVLGITARNLTASEQKQARTKTGIRVSSVEPTDRGILPGDIILELNRQAVTDIKRFEALGRPLEQASHPVTLQLLRGKTRYSITFTP